MKLRIARKMDTAHGSSETARIRISAHGGRFTPMTSYNGLYIAFAGRGVAETQLSMVGAMSRAQTSLR
jgi:hypothetical protein